MIRQKILTSKVLLLIVMFCLFSGIAFAACPPKDNIVDKFFDTCTSPGDSVCDNGEYPLVNSDCSISLKEIISFDFLDYAWVTKLVMLIIIFFAIRSNMFKDKNLLVMVMFVMFLILIVSQGMLPKTPISTSTTQPLNTITTTTTWNYDDHYPVIEVDVRGFWSDMKWGEAVWPGHPVLGWLIIFVLLILFIPLFFLTIDKVEGMYRRLW